MGFFDKMFSGLTKTRKNIEELEEIFRNYDIDSEDFYDELEEMLIMADVGGETTAQIMMDYKRILLRRYINKGKAAKEAFVEYMRDMLGLYGNDKAIRAHGYDGLLQDLCIGRR